VCIINPQIRLWGKASLVLMLFNVERSSTLPTEPPLATFFVGCWLTGGVREQIQNARENPIQTKSNVENLLDLDLGGAPSTEDSAVPSPTIPNNTTSNILDDLGGLSLSSAPPQQQPVTSPVGPQVSSPPPDPFSSLMSPHAPQPAAPAPNSMDDLLGIFGGSGGPLNGGANAFGGENVWGDVSVQQHGKAAQPTSGAKSQTNDDILGLF
jgi:hypothetical protein